MEDTKGKFSTIASLLILGLFIGAGLGYWYGSSEAYKAGFDDGVYSVETELGDSKGQEEIVSSSGDTGTNPLGNVKTNPFEDIKTNPFE